MTTRATTDRRQAAVPVSPEELFEGLDEETKAELIDGELVYHMPASAVHNRILGLVQTVMIAVATRQGAGEVFVDMLEMRLGRQRYVPDASFVATAHLDRVLPTRLEGPADLVVEVLSPESVTRDRGVKMRDYAAAGVQEYWLIDPDAQQVQVYAHQAGGTFQPLPPDASGTNGSQVLPGFALREEWLWPATGHPPDVLAALRAHGLA